jgi:hypothetical protein
MAIDPSIAYGASQQPNLLQTLGGVTALRGQIAQQQANLAASQAYKQATDPNTGQIDYGALTAALSQGPAAYNLPQIQAQVNEARNSALNFDKGKLELAQKRTDLLSGGFGGLLASGNVTPQAVQSIAINGIKSGLFTSDDAVNFMADMPTDPAQLQNWVKQKYVGFSTDADRLKTLMPQTQVINNGGSQQIMAIDPLTGQPRLTGVVPNTLTPGQQVENVQVYDPATQTMRTITKAQQLQMQGDQGGIAPTGAVPQSGGLGTGRINLAPTGAPGLQIAPALGAQAAAEVTGKGSADAALALQGAADAATPAIYQLQNMRGALTDINTGPNADWQGKAAALALQVSPEMAKKIGIDPQKVASLEEFKKYSTQLAQNLAAQLGQGTNEKLASAVAANPSAGLSKLGNQQIIDVLIATQRGIQAKNLAWQQSGLPPEQYNKFSTQFNKDIDPRVFAVRDMTPEQAYKMLDSLTPREQAEFKLSLGKARAQGLLQ